MMSHRTTRFKIPRVASFAGVHRERPLYAYDYADTWLGFPLGKVLDYGCGNGAFMSRIANRSTECWGIDIDEEKVLLAGWTSGAQTRYVRPGQPLPFADESFDTVVIIEVIEHVVDERAVLRECARVLVPGGKLLLTTPNSGVLTFLDPGNFKFIAPRLHRLIHCSILGNTDYYEQRFGRTRQSEKGMIADFQLGRSPWHRHYSWRQIQALAPPNLETVAWAVYFPAFRALWSLQLALKVMTFGRLRALPQPLRWLNYRLSRTQSLLGDQLVILFRKKH